jgi:hypothetical protein
MKKLRFTEEFLWNLHRLLEAAGDTHKALMPRSWKDIIAPEWRELRLVYEKKKRKRSFSKFISYLKRMGYIKVPSGQSVGAFRLTKKGKEKAFAGYKTTRVLPLRKDGKMIMLMFDIPKRKERIRQAFRSALEFLDYQMLQKSVWISTKDVLEETERVVREYGLDDCVNLFVIEKIQVQK